jgi:hypothetical protein
LTNDTILSLQEINFIFKVHFGNYLLSRKLKTFAHLLLSYYFQKIQIFSQESFYFTSCCILLLIKKQKISFSCPYIIAEKTCIKSKQWPLAPNLQKWRITRANVSNASHIFPEMTFGECRRVWRVRHGILANLANFKARSFYVQKKDIFRYKTI